MNELSRTSGNVRDEKIRDPDISRTDRSTIRFLISKYIGETEKNLECALDGARRTNAILFIDETDALFGKCSEAKDTHDRFTNMEASYPLPRIESHGGVTILTTNLAANIDEAVSRSVHYIVDVPWASAKG